MAKVLTEQPRRWTPASLDPRQFGDGAGVHAAIPFDMVRWLNNLRSYREPSFQFLHDISVIQGDNTVKTRIGYYLKAVGSGDGNCMLGQAPIYVPTGATRLRWSLGIYRSPRPPVGDTPLVEVNVNTIKMYLCSEPCRQLRDPVPASITLFNEISRQFDESSLTGAWTSNTVSAGATSNGSGDPVYNLITSNTWTDFTTRGVTNVNDKGGKSWSNLIVTAGFSGGVVGESIRGAELSVWFEWDDAEAMLDDAVREACRNGKPALAQVLRREAQALFAYAQRPRPIHSWWGGADIATEPNSESHVYRQTITGSKGMPAIRGVTLAVPIANAAGVPKTGLTLNHLDPGQVFAQLVPQTPGRIEDLNDQLTDLYPKYVTPISIFGEHVSDYDVSPTTGRDLRVQIGESPGTYGPRPTSGMVIEAPVKDPTMGVDALPLDPYSMGTEIWGENTDADRDLRALRDFFDRVARDKSIHFSWGTCRNGTGTFGYNATSGRSTDWCYILNRDYGSGAGIAPTVTGPGIKIPTRYTAFGRETTVRAYVRVLARMTGGTNTGRVGYSIRNNSGGMTGFFAATHTPTISGTTLQWYPSGNFDAANDPYIPLNANPAYDTDNLMLCVDRNGTTDDVIVAGFVVCVRATLV